MFRSVLVLTLACAATSIADDDSLYRYLILQNKAQLVMLSDGRLIAPDLTGRLARALREVDEGNRKSGRPLSSNYLDLEEQLVARIGPEATNIHMGRSRNDLGATSERLAMREQTLAILELQAAARQSLLELAAKNIDAVIPGFTHAVQAQPTSLAHYLSAFIYSLERDEARLRGAFTRIDASPLGSAAFTTSGFRVDRERLQQLLGFSSLVENSYDSIMVSTVDSKAELVSTLAVSALNIGRFAQQFLIQYSDSRPGLNLADEAVGHSSIMPQKRNPKQAESLRILASSVLGNAQTVLITAHNTPGGEVADIRVPLLERVWHVTRDSSDMLRTLASLVRSMRVDRERMLEIVNGDYSVVTEIADTLLREGGIPFRVGYKVAAEVAAYGRANRKRPIDLTYEDVAAAYRRIANGQLPLNEKQVRDALNPESFIRSRRGSGGPQPDEMRRILEAHRGRIETLQRWVDAERERIRSAEDKLNAAFSRLLTIQ